MNLYVNVILNVVFNKKLTSLKGSPKYVGKDFWCMISKIETLDGAPEYVGNDFYCRGNPFLPKEEVIKYYKSGAVKGTIYSDYDGEFE